MSKGYSVASENPAPIKVQETFPSSPKPLLEIPPELLSAVTRDKNCFRRPTIGIIGFSHSQVAKLNRIIIEVGNKIGLTSDQQFPEILAIGIHCRNNDIALLKSQAQICADFGCDIIAVTDEMSESHTKTLSDTTASKEIISGTKLSELAIEIFSRSLKLTINPEQKFKRPDNIFFTDDDIEIFTRTTTEGDEKLQIEDNINAMLLSDQKNRDERIAKRNSYEILTESGERLRFTGVIGGGGPLASADFCERLAEISVPYIHYSVNAAPGKHLYGIGRGPSYVPHYRNAADFFQKIGATKLNIPCNTAHSELENIFDRNITTDIVVDIRTSVFDEYRDDESFILLGTNKTTGVDLPQQETGLYLRKIPQDRNVRLILPTIEQQRDIMTAVFLVKEGKLDEAKNMIVSVIEEIKDKYDIQNPFKPFPKVILGCTELPLPFTTLEMAEYTSIKGNIFTCINPAQAMAEKTLTALNKERSRERSSSSHSSSDSSESHNEARSRSHSKSQTPGTSPTSDQNGSFNARLLQDIEWKTITYKEKQFQIAIFNNMKGTCRIALQTDGSDKISINSFLGDLFKDFKNYMRQHELEENNQDRLRSGSYLSLHLDNDTKRNDIVENFISTFAQEKGINIQYKKPPSQQRTK